MELRGKMDNLGLFEINYSFASEGKSFRQNETLFVATDTLEAAINVVRVQGVGSQGKQDIVIHQAMKRNLFGKRFAVDPRFKEAK